MKTREEKNKRRRRKLFVAFVMILFTGVLLSTSTYAWFTANRTVTVDSIDVNVTAAEGLQLSVDGTNWKPVISNQDLLNAHSTYTAENGNKNQLPQQSGKMTATSTIGKVGADGLMEMFVGNVFAKQKTNQLTARREIEKQQNDAGSFIAFDLFFKISTGEKESMPIYLTKTSKVISVGEDKGLQNASRIAFIPGPTQADGTELKTIQQSHAANGSLMKIWEPNFDVHTPAGVANAKDVYGKTVTPTGNLTALAYHGVKAEIDEPNSQQLNSTDGTYFEAVTPAITTPAGDITEQPQVFTLSNGITKVRVYMWVEGQDVDCEDQASGTSIGYNIGFTMDKTA